MQYKNAKYIYVLPVIGDIVNCFVCVLAFMCHAFVEVVVAFFCVSIPTFSYMPYIKLVNKFNSQIVITMQIFYSGGLKWLLNK